MYKRICAYLAGLVMLFAPLAVAAPAQATTYYNCDEFYSRITFQDWYASAYPGVLADGSVKVIWSNCLSSDSSPNRNNALRAVLNVRCDNPGWIKGLWFNLSNVEGMDLGPVFVPCDGTYWNHKVVDLRTPGFTYESKGWRVAIRRENTAFASTQFVPEVWSDRGPSTWGGRYNRTLAD